MYSFQNLNTGNVPSSVSNLALTGIPVASSMAASKHHSEKWEMGTATIFLVYIYRCVPYWMRLEHLTGKL